MPFFQILENSGLKTTHNTFSRWLCSYSNNRSWNSCVLTSDFGVQANQVLFTGYWEMSLKIFLKFVSEIIIHYTLLEVLSKWNVLLVTVTDYYILYGFLSGWIGCYTWYIFSSGLAHNTSLNCIVWYLMFKWWVVFNKVQRIVSFIAHHLDKGVTV